MYHEPRSPSPPQRKNSLYPLHDPSCPLLKPMPSLYLIESQTSSDSPIKRQLKPVRPVSHEIHDRKSGLGRTYSPERPGSAMNDVLTLPNDLLYPPVDKGRRLGRRHLADTNPRDPIKGINVISTDMFLRPQKVPMHTASHIDLTNLASLEPSAYRARAQLDPAVFDRVCHTTREVYKAVVEGRQQVKKTTISNTHDLLSWP